MSGARQRAGSRRLGTLSRPWWANGHEVPFTGWRDAADLGTATAVVDAEPRQLATGTRAWWFEIPDNAGGWNYCGMLRDAPAGDFVLGVRMATRRLLGSGQKKPDDTRLYASVVHVDGSDIDTDDFHGAGVRFHSSMNEGDCQENVVVGTSGTRWANPTYSDVLPLELPTLDVFFERTSTSLNVYSARPDSFPVRVCASAYSVGTGAGLVGVHVRLGNNTAGHNLGVYVLACQELGRVPT